MRSRLAPSQDVNRGSGAALALSQPRVSYSREAGEVPEFFPSPACGGSTSGRRPEGMGERTLRGLSRVGSPEHQLPLRPRPKASATSPALRAVEEKRLDLRHRHLPALRAVEESLRQFRRIVGLWKALVHFLAALPVLILGFATSAPHHQVKANDDAEDDGDNHRLPRRFRDGKRHGSSGAAHPT